MRASTTCLLAVVVIGCGTSGVPMGGGGGGVATGGAAAAGGGPAIGGGSAAGGGTATGGGSATGGGAAAGGGIATGGGSATGGGAGTGGGSATGGGPSTGGGSASGGGSAAGGGSATGGGAAITPETDGPYAVVTSTQSLAVTSTRTVGLNLYVPSGVTGSPLVVLHPGFRLSATLYDSYGKHLASVGITTIIIDPPYSFIGGPTHAELATYLGQVIDWAIAQNTSSGALPGIDPSKLLLVGHSLGGKISMLRASTDTRVKAVFGIDPVDAIDPLSTMPSADYPSVTPELMAMITVPLALTGETTNSSCSGSFCQACAPAADNFHQYAIHASSPAVEIEVTGANHMSFLDDPNCGLTCSVCPAGTDNPANSARLIHRYLTAFANLELKGDASARDWLAGNQMAADVQSGQVTMTTWNAF